MALLRYVLLFSGMLFFFSACDIVNPDESIPAYIHVEPFEMDADYGVEGSASEKITDVWVFAGGQNIGVYDLPATLPILLEDTSDIRLFPGIKKNGISASPVIYPFYRSFAFSGELEAATIDTIRPQTSYLDDLTFVVNERFDVAHSMKFDIDGNLNTRMEITNTGSEVLEGGGSGKIVLDTTNSLIEVGTLDAFTDLPTTGLPVYLELDYRTDIELAISLVGFDQTGGSFPGAVLFLNPQSEWNKVYFDVTDTVTFLNDAAISGFRILLAARLPRDGNGNFTLDRAVILVDNLKLLHFQ
jgi:hypothetical protein